MNPDLQGGIHIEAGKLSISRISLSNSGMYQCVAQNEHGSVYASAELKVVGKQMISLSAHTDSGGREWNILYIRCAIDRVKLLPPWINKTWLKRLFIEACLGLFFPYFFHTISPFSCELQFTQLLEMHLTFSADAQLLLLRTRRQMDSAVICSLASPPDFTLRPVKKSTVVQRGAEAVLECRPYASPRATTSWWRGGELLMDTDR